MVNLFKFKISNALNTVCAAHGRRFIDSIRIYSLANHSANRRLNSMTGNAVKTNFMHSFHKQHSKIIDETICCVLFASLSVARCGRKNGKMCNDLLVILKSRRGMQHARCVHVLNGNVKKRFEHTAAQIHWLVLIIQHLREIAAGMCVRNYFMMNVQKKMHSISVHFFCCSFFPFVSVSVHRFCSSDGTPVGI